ncbi:MAG: hypothetical protein ACE5J3_12925 [Methanosarcinales archaeon]
MNRIKSDFNKKAREIYDVHKHELEEKHSGKIVAIDLDAEEIYAIIGKDETLSFMQKAYKERAGHKMYLLRVGLEKPVIWMRGG